MFQPPNVPPIKDPCGNRMFSDLWREIMAIAIIKCTKIGKKANG